MAFFCLVYFKFCCFHCLKEKCQEEISARKLEVERLDQLIVHSPERAAHEREKMEEKVGRLMLGALVLNCLPRSGCVCFSFWFNYACQMTDCT